MKKILLAAVFAVLSVSVFAQVQFGVGVLAGAGIDLPLTKDSTKLADQGRVGAPNFGWSAGIKADAIINPYFAIEYDMLITSIGYTATTTPSKDKAARAKAVADGTAAGAAAAAAGGPAAAAAAGVAGGTAAGEIFDETKGSYTTVTTGTSIELNLLARPQYPLGNDSSVYALVGLGYQAELGTANAVTAKGTDDIGKIAPTDKEFTTKNTIPYQALNLPVGLGYQMPVGPGMLSFDARYNVPLAVFSAITKDTKADTTEEGAVWRDVTDEASTDGAQDILKLTNLRIMVGYTYLF